MNIFFVGLEFGPKTKTFMNLLKEDEQFGSHSYEYNNLYLSLKEIPNAKVKLFPFEKALEVGREKMNEELLAAVLRERPDLVFVVPYTDEIDKKTIGKIRDITKVVAWFSDDHWRFDNYSRHYAPYFSWVITTYSRAVERYKKLGVSNVILSQWAVNKELYKPTEELGKGPDVSFVGTWSRPRENLISAIRAQGIEVEAYGDGWPNGRVSTEKMLQTFSESRINLALNSPPGFFNANSLGRLFGRRSFNRIVPDFHIVRNFRSWLKRGIAQIKGRHFEIPACGGFLITAPADNLGKYYDIGREIVTYDSVSGLVEKIKYYLNHEEERQLIAEAGYRRTIKDHTYEKRFNEIFKTMGLIK
jgi:spore maturation protein CgeB